MTQPRDYLPTGSSVTVEARVKVLSGSNELSFLSPVFFGVQVGQGANAQVYLWPDRVGTRYSGNNAFTVVTLDMTQYHTIRLAMGPQATFSVWVDEALLFTGTPLPGRRGSAVYFTSGLLEQAISDSYWDYVRYSKAYLPVPEPSGLLALAGGMSGLLALSRRRRGAG